MYLIVIVEDTPAAADTLRLMLSRYSEENSIDFAVETFESAAFFVEARPAVDLVFMDIDMPEMNGMEAAELLRDYDSEVQLIFVTNLAQYALHGYAVDALDFMVKPVEYADFHLRMDRAMRQLNKKERKSITLPTANGMRVVALRDLIYVDLLHHDLYYHVAELDEALRQRGTIRGAADELGDEFVRISSGCLVNMHHVKLIRQNSVVLSNGEELYFSRGCKKSALEVLNAYVGRSL